MALVPFTGTISAATANANFYDAAPQIVTNRQAGQKDHTVMLRLDSLATGAAVPDSTMSFVAPDNMEVRVLVLRVTDTGAGRVITGTLTVDNGDSTYLGLRTISVAVTSVVGTVDSRTGTPALDLRSYASFLRLRKGVRYRLSLSVSAGTVTGPLQLVAQMRCRRRSA